MTSSKTLRSWHEISPLSPQLPQSLRYFVHKGSLLISSTRAPTAMADSVRGDGIIQADGALAALVAVPEELDRARERFTGSPPSYRSRISHNSTLSQSPILTSEEQLHHDREERAFQLSREHIASMPSAQFDAQEAAEHRRVLEYSSTRIRPVPIGVDFCKIAKENVKESWLEQGIWNENWEKTNLWRWKHEEPLGTESESETDPDAEVEPFYFPFPHAPKPRRRKNDEELQRIAERRPLRERDRQASRPFYQFLYQVSKEREWVEDVMNAPIRGPTSSDPNVQAVLQELERRGWPRNQTAVKTNIPDPPGINTMAYEAVKQTWVERGVWDKKWGLLPGMSWKHEHPLEELLREEMGEGIIPSQAGPLDHNTREVEEAPPRLIFDVPPSAESDQETAGMPDTPRQEPPSAESRGHENGRDWEKNISRSHPYYGSIFTGPIPPPQRSSSAINPPGLPNGDTSNPSATSASCSDREENPKNTGTRSRPLPWPTRQQGKGATAVSNGPIMRTARNARGSTHESRISKARKKAGPDARRRPKRTSDISHAARQPLTELEGPRVPVTSFPTSPRRSRRLQEAREKIAADPTSTTVHSHSRSSHPTFERIRAGSKSAGSAKSTRVTKRRPKTAR